VELTAAAGAEDSGIPPVHAGVATGDVVLRRGEVYGATANLAARLCDLAEPGTMLADPDTRAAGRDVGWRSAGRRHPKGFRNAIEVFALDGRDCSRLSSDA
jgi:class 3 adenylate cyclase